MLRVAATLVVLALARAAAALTQGQIDATAARAGNGVGPIVRRLASPHLDGRDNATVGSERAQRFIVGRLKRLGAGANTAANGAEAYRQHFVQSGQTGTNLLAVIRGRELPDEYVVLGAHYDHFGTHSDASGHCTRNAPAGGARCPGATDDASGVAAVLAIGRAIRKLPMPPRRSVVLALWDAEEDGLLGSLYYVGHPLVPLAATRAYVNFDIQGSDLLPSLSHSTFAVSPETGGSPLQAFVDAADQAEPALDVRPLSYIFGQGRSDYANFVANDVPTVFLGDGTNGCYHTVDDDIGIVDRRKLAAQARVGFRIAVQLAETSTPPPFRAPSQALATYADAVSLGAVFTEGLADLALFSPADRAMIQDTQADIAGLVAAGAGSFDQSDVGVLFSAAIQGIDAIERLGCLPRR